MDHDQIFTEFNVGAARQISLSAEVRMRAEYNIREKSRLKYVVDEQAELLKVREKEIKDLKTQLLLKEAEAAEVIRLRAEASKFEVVEKSLRDEVSQNDNLVDQVHGLETSFTKLQEKVTVYENCMGQLERFQDEQIKVVNDKFNKLYTDFVEIALHLGEKFYPHLLTTISGRRWLLTHGMELSIAKCLNSTEYLSKLSGVADWHITHSAEADYLSALQTHSLAENGLTDVTPHVDQLMVPIHHCPDQRVIGASTLSLSLDVSSSRVRKIKENITNRRSALRDVFVPLSEPLSVTALTGTEGTSNLISASVDTTTALSVTFASASSIPPISTDDYEVVRADGREGAGADANPFPNVDDAELNIFLVRV
ncbi:hypothetical protein Tco_0009594 [Tanacetum coccineum]